MILKKHYQKELDTGLNKAIEKVAGVLFKKAFVEEDLSAVIFFLKTRARWSDKGPEELSKTLSIIEQALKINSSK